MPKEIWDLYTCKNTFELVLCWPSSGRHEAYIEYDYKIFYVKTNPRSRHYYFPHFIDVTIRVSLQEIENDTNNLNNQSLL